MAFNPSQNYLQGFAQSRAIRNEDMAREEDARLRQQRESFFTAKDKGDALKQMLVDQPQIGMAFQKEMQTDEQGIQALIDDSVMLKHQIEIDPTGQGAMQLLQSRLQAIKSKPFGNSFHTEKAINVLSGENGPQKLLENMNSFLDLTTQIKGKKSDAKEPKTSETKNFEQLQELEKTGTPEQVETFKKLLNLTNDPKLSSKAEKVIIDSQDSYFKSGEQARKMELLAEDISRVNIGGGLASTLSESLKSILGSQDEVTALRKEFNGIRASQAVSNLPAGAASDKDIALALSGFPSENANAEDIIGFLRGQAKLARINEAYNEYKAEYIAENNSPKGLISGWKKKISDKDYLATFLNPKDSIKEALKTTNVGRFQIEVQQ